MRGPNVPWLNAPSDHLSYCLHVGVFSYAKILGMFSWDEVECMVCGKPEIDVDLLEVGATDLYHHICDCSQVRCARSVNSMSSLVLHNARIYAKLPVHASASCCYDRSSKASSDIPDQMKRDEMKSKSETYLWGQPIAGGDRVLRMQEGAAAHQTILASSSGLYDRRALDANKVHMGKASGIF